MLLLLIPLILLLLLHIPLQPRVLTHIPTPTIITATTAPTDFTTPILSTTPSPTQSLNPTHILSPNSANIITINSEESLLASLVLCEKRKINSNSAFNSLTKARLQD